MQVTEVKVEKYCRIKEIHLLELRTGEWKEKYCIVEKMHSQMKELTKDLK